MAVERNRFGFDGEISFECDECSEEIHIGLAEFKSAVSVAKQEGWRMRKINDDWHHLRPACDETELLR